MKTAIQCAAKKDPDAGCMRTREGKRVFFVADPTHAPAGDDIVFARPDDPSSDGKSWREKLVSYNRQPGSNPLKLLPAYRLYANDAYRKLVDRYGVANVFILSAGWGLIPANFLTPNYDITFSPSADRYKRRGKRMTYHDLRLLEEGCTEPLVFFGGKDYLPLFCSLTDQYQGRRIVFYNSQQKPQAHGVEFVRYRTTTRTNWHYESVAAFLAGTVFADR